MPKSKHRRQHRQAAQEPDDTLKFDFMHPWVVQQAQATVVEVQSRPAPSTDEAISGFLNELVGRHGRTREGFSVLRRLATLDVDALTQGWSVGIAGQVEAMLQGWVALVEDGPQPSFDNPIAHLFAAITDAQTNDGLRWHVTIATSTPRGQALYTFGTDNLYNLQAYALTEGARRIEKGITVRRVEDRVGDEPKVTVTGLATGGMHVALMSAQDVLESYTVDHQTGRSLPMDPNVTYVGTHELLPALAFKVDPSAFPTATQALH